MSHFYSLSKISLFFTPSLGLFFFVRRRAQSFRNSLSWFFLVIEWMLAFEEHWWRLANFNFVSSMNFLVIFVCLLTPKLVIGVSCYYFHIPFRVIAQRFSCWLSLPTRKLGLWWRDWKSSSSFTDVNAMVMTISMIVNENARGTEDLITFRI